MHGDKKVSEAGHHETPKGGRGDPGYTRKAINSIKNYQINEILDCHANPWFARNDGFYLHATKPLQDQDDVAS